MCCFFGGEAKPFVVDNGMNTACSQASTWQPDSRLANLKIALEGLNKIEETRMTPDFGAIERPL